MNLGKTNSSSLTNDSTVVDNLLSAEAKTFITSEARNQIYMQFQSLRSSSANRDVDSVLNPSMYIVTSNDKINNYLPSFVDRKQVPEKFVLAIVLQFAKNTINTLNKLFENGDIDLDGLLPVAATDDSSNGTPPLFRVLEDIFSDDNIFHFCHLIFNFSSSLVVQDTMKCIDTQALQSPMSHLCNLELPELGRIQVVKNMNVQDLSVRNLMFV